MEKVVYILGAGFSAPLKIPTISDFITKAKDLLERSPDRYAHFDSVLSEIGRLHSSKSYYNVNLHDIEVVMSHLQMEDQVKDQERTGEFAKFISDVIEAYTPTMPGTALQADREGYLPATFTHRFPIRFWGDENNVMTGYGLFVANLLNLQLEVHGVSTSHGSRKYLIASRMRHPIYQYSVVTLNYDMVLENCVKFIHPNLRAPGPGSQQGIPAITIAKLHGSVDTGVTPPTWKKQASEQVRGAWELAYQLLSEANHIRILGYSLPVSDSYIRYLLSLSVLGCKNLKTIDIICLDTTPFEAHNRYHDFLTFPKYRLKNGDIQEYLRLGVVDEDDNYRPSTEKISELSDRQWIEYAGLEHTHELFMSDR